MSFKKKRIIFLLLAFSLSLLLTGSLLSLFLQKKLFSEKAPPTLTFAQATARARSTNPYPPYNGMLALTDALADNSHGYAWSRESDGVGTCQFQSGSYHVTATAQPYPWVENCSAASPSFRNFVYQVQMIFVSGTGGGLVFRGTGQAQFYYFYINQNGTYGIDLYSRKGTNGMLSLKSGFSTAIHTGILQANVIAIVANGRHFDLYVNQQRIDSLIDNNLAHGHIGVAASEADGTPTDIIFRNVKVWTI